jgi:hypothetical protein
MRPGSSERRLRQHARGPAAHQPANGEKPSRAESSSRTNPSGTREQGKRASDCCRSPQKSRTRWARGTLRGALFAVFGALLPKCPLCVAAWMGAVGLSGLAARVDPRALWLAAVTALTLVAAPLITRVFFWIQESPGCCGLSLSCDDAAPELARARTELRRAAASTEAPVDGRPKGSSAEFFGHLTS